MVALMIGDDIQFHECSVFFKPKIANAVSGCQRNVFFFIKWKCLANPCAYDGRFTRIVFVIVVA